MIDFVLFAVNLSSVLFMKTFHLFRATFWVKGIVNTFRKDLAFFISL